MGFKKMRMSELGQKSKLGERGEAYFSFSFVQWNLDITRLDITKSLVLNEGFFLRQLQYNVWKRTSISPNLVLANVIEVSL